MRYFKEYFKIAFIIAFLSMSVDSKLLELIRQRYPYGITFDCASKMLLERMLDEQIYDEEIEELKNTMFTNKDGLSIFPDSIADECTLSEIRSSVIEFVDRFGKYEPEAFYVNYKDRINNSIIRTVDDFQDLLVFLLPKNYSNKAMVRLKVGQSTEKLIQAIEDVVVNDYGGIVSFDQLKQDVQGFTEKRLRHIVDRNSRKLAFIDSPTGPVVETIDSFHLPEDFIEVVHDIEGRLSDMGIESDPAIMNPILSLHYGYNFYYGHDLTTESYKKVVETFDMVEEDE